MIRETIWIAKIHLQVPAPFMPKLDNGTKAGRSVCPGQTHEHKHTPSIPRGKSLPEMAYEILDFWYIQKYASDFCDFCDLCWFFWFIMISCDFLWFPWFSMISVISHDFSDFCDLSWFLWFLVILMISCDFQWFHLISHDFRDFYDFSWFLMIPPIPTASTDSTDSYWFHGFLLIPWISTDFKDSRSKEVLVCKLFDCFEATWLTRIKCYCLCATWLTLLATAHRWPMLWNLICL